MRDDFSEDVKRTLANRVSNDCSNPECHAPTSGPQLDSTKALNIGVAAHITSASPGGPRFNPSFTSEQRCHAENGIWLCQNCAKLIDNDVSRFSETLLRAWKTIAEDRARNAIGRTSTQVPESEAQRKRRAILALVGKIVTVSQMATGNAVMMIGPKINTTPALVYECTEFYVKVGSVPGYSGNWCRSIPLEHIVIGFDDPTNRVELQERST
jgi:hypothetical protein